MKKSDYFKKGHPKVGGRKKGSENKFTASMKEAFLCVYEDLQEESGGGNNHLKNWASKNQTEFYKICSRMIPQQVTADINHKASAQELDDEELIYIATGGGTGITAPQSGEKKSNSVH